ncbi:MAG: TolC family protein [Saprospiraceae bacterium]|nr:TolC family protein [Saprospiraceae bacterium]
MKFSIFLPAMLLLSVSVHGTDSLSIMQCREAVLRNNPLQSKKGHADAISALQHRNIATNSLPRIQLGAQASWQSEVFGFPIENPVFNIPEVPKDQYKATIDISQRLWDGGSDRPQRRQRELERDLAIAQVDADVFSLRETATDLFFRALLLQESEAVQLAAQKDLETRLKQTEAAVAEGTALRTAADQIRIQLLKTEQQIAATRADKQSALLMLARWMGRDDTDVVLIVPDEGTLTPYAAMTRPEHAVFTLQQRSLQNNKEALTLRTHPRLDAFLQGGFGRPNPFNFFETGFEPFAMIGLRATWAPFDWGTRKREAQVIDLQIKNIEAQRHFFDLKLDATSVKDLEDRKKWQAQLAQDDAIVSLQADIVKRSEAQVNNGIMTMTDYLSQVNLLTQAQLARKTHQLQALHAQEMWVAKWSNQ